MYIIIDLVNALNSVFDCLVIILEVMTDKHGTFQNHYHRLTTSGLKSILYLEYPPMVCERSHIDPFRPSTRSKWNRRFVRGGRKLILAGSYGRACPNYRTISKNWVSHGIILVSLILFCTEKILN